MAFSSILKIASPYYTWNWQELQRRVLGMKHRMARGRRVRVHRETGT